VLCVGVRVRVALAVGIGIGTASGDCSTGTLSAVSLRVHSQLIKRPIHSFIHPLICSSSSTIDSFHVLLLLPRQSHALTILIRERDVFSFAPFSVPLFHRSRSTRVIVYPSLTISQDNFN
jgi:hypothetical protein